MNIQIHIVDAFTAVPFKGNPAAVCVLDAFPEDSAMQQVALEMNLSETAFLVKKSTLEYNLRWFAPNAEVDLCGHATLAATHILLETGHVGVKDTVTYHTLSGLLRARVINTSIELDFPELAGEAVTPPAELKALGVKIVACEQNRDNYLVEVRDYKTLLACTPDFRALLALDREGIIVTTAKDVPNYDFASRYFVPNCTISEDPVTGSAHTFLAPYWAKKLGKNTFHAIQASKRQGVLDVTLDKGRVLIRGQAVTILKGELLLPNLFAKEKAA